MAVTVIKLLRTRVREAEARLQWYPNSAEQPIAVTTGLSQQYVMIKVRANEWSKDVH